MSKNEKIIGIRSNSKNKKRLQDEIFRTQITRENWLEHNLTHAEGKTKLSFGDKERWITIPSSEYNQLVAPVFDTHAKSIFNRIKEHVILNGRELSFDNLMSECEVFAEINDFKIIRTVDKNKTIFKIKTFIGMGYSKFINALISIIIEFTNDYEIISEIIETYEVQFILKKC